MALRLHCTRFGGIRAWSRELLAADICLAVGDEPCERLVQGVERAVPRRIAEYLPGAGDARGDAAEGVLAGGVGVLGSDPAGGICPVDGLQPRLTAQPPSDAPPPALPRHPPFRQHPGAGPPHGGPAPPPP